MNVIKSPIDFLNKEKDNKIKFQYITKHLPYFNELKIIARLQGKEYDIILKGVYYSIIGTILRDKKIKIGQLETDPRIPCTIAIPSGQGKKNIKNAIYKILTELNYTVDIPLSLHSQQLIGKVINRGKPMKPNWIKNPGYLNRDYLIIDEAYKLFTSKDEDIQESRRAIRISKDTIGENLVEKKQVDNTFSDDEKLSYYPKVSMTQFLQPKRVPLDVVEEGDLRRDLCLYVSQLAERDKTPDYNNRLKDNNDITKSLEIFCTHLKNIQKNILPYKFNFSEKAIERMSELHLLLLKRGFIHSEKGANFSNMVDFTLQDIFVRLACCISAIHNTNDIDENIIDLAFMDLLEFFSLQLDFVKTKVSGNLDYGNKWNGARENDQELLEWLYNKGAIDEQSSTITINQFKKAIATIRNVSYDEETGSGQAPKIYLRLKDEQLINSKQEGQYSSKVWLTFTPKHIGNKIIFEGTQGIQGVTIYNTIISDLDTKISSLGIKHPNHPEHPESIEVKEVENFENG